MFGLGMPEILLILAIALIVIGPKKLPELAKTLGRAMGEFKRSAQDFKRSIDIETTVKDTSVTDIDPPPAKDLRDIVKEAKAPDDPDAADTDTSKDRVRAGDGAAGPEREKPANGPGPDASFSDSGTSEK